MSNDDDCRLDDKQYGHVDAIYFDKFGAGPDIGEVCVRANVHPNPNYPRTRIYLGAWGDNVGDVSFGGMCVTPQDAIKIANWLRQAAAEAMKNCPSLVPIDVEDYT